MENTGRQEREFCEFGAAVKLSSHRSQSKKQLQLLFQCSQHAGVAQSVKHDIAATVNTQFQIPPDPVCVFYLLTLCNGGHVLTRQKAASSHGCYCVCCPASQHVPGSKPRPGGIFQH